MTSKRWALASMALVLAMGSAAWAEDAPKQPKHQIVKGEIVKIDGANVSVQPVKKKTAAEAPPVLIAATTDATTVTIDGEKKAVADLAVGQTVAVTLDTDGKSALSITEGEREKKPGETSGPATK